MKNNLTASFTILTVLFASVPFADAQTISSLVVEIKTGDKRFAGTDDSAHLLLGGKDFSLDNPNKNDFERNNTDVFVLPISDLDYSVELIRAIGRIGIIKPEDSRFGGGWLFQGIKVWMNDQSAAPIYENDSVNKWLDGDHRGWHATLDEEGWNLPEPPPFPACTAGDIVILLKGAAGGKPDEAQEGKKDSDCDGIPDDEDPTFDPNQPDRDQDGLPDKYEEQNGLNPDSNDSDNDGWLDNKNVKDLLLLTKVECVDESGRVELGSDEIYVVSEDVRFPLSSTLDKHWVMDDDTKVEPFIIVDARAAVNPGQIPEYKTRIRLREADIKVLERPSDNTFVSLALDWSRNDSKEIDHNADGKHYKLSFQSFTTTFMDAAPVADLDLDGDGLKDSKEFQISSQAPSLRPAIESAVAGYNGLASPFRKEMFIELDAVGEDNHIPNDAKQEVASQFYFNNISVRIDDGYLHGGENLPFDRETVTIGHLNTQYKPNNFWAQRSSHYRYGLTTAHTEGAGSNGNSEGTNIIVGRIDQFGMIGDYSAIVFLHEWGHTLHLCHPKGGSPPVSAEGCNANGGAPAGTDPRCAHYCGVPGDSNTAMGDTVGGLEIVGGAVGGAIAGAIIGWLIGGPIGAGIGFVVGGFLGGLGGFLFSDAYERVVNFHPNEWVALVFNVF